MAVAVVTGAGSGIGRAVANTLLDGGWNVALAGRNPKRLREVGDGNDAALAVSTDVTDVRSVDALFDTVHDHFGRLDFLFNNAGLFGVQASIDDYPLDAWTSVVETNLTGSFICARRAFAAMKAQEPSGGRILNNGSLASQVPRPQAVAYTASKHATTGLTKALNLEGRAYGIACGQIDIGNAATAMVEAVQQGVLQADGSIASEPTIDVQHVAKVVAYIASLPLDANVEFITIMATKMPFVGRG